MTFWKALYPVAAVSAHLLAISAHAATPPSNPCSLLTPAQVGNAMGGTYAAPEKGIAPRPFANSGPGTDCHYNGNGSVLFRIYYDASASDATALFAKLKMFFGAGQNVSGIGDEAYTDEKGALHARKGNVRFYLEAGDGKQAAVAKLGGIVAGQL